MSVTIQQVVGAVLDCRAGARQPGSVDRNHSMLPRPVQARQARTGARRAATAGHLSFGIRSGVAPGVQVIQSEYALRQAEDAFRHDHGRGYRSFLWRARSRSDGARRARRANLRSIDAAAALQQAMGKRPELEAARQSLANDDTSIRLAHNNLLPDLRVNGNYSGNGLNNLATAQGLGVAAGGFGDIPEPVVQFRISHVRLRSHPESPASRTGAGQAALGTP